MVRSNLGIIPRFNVGAFVTLGMKTRKEYDCQPFKLWGEGEEGTPRFLIDNSA